MKSVGICLLTIVVTCIICLDVTGEELPEIAKWYNNYDAAISLRFDDAHGSHVEFVVPLLNEFNFKATFMVIPKRRGYLKYKDFWEQELPKMGHHLGNHTMHHRGAETVDEAEYEIGETSRLIRSIYPEQGKLLVFASGGGEKWGGKLWHNASPEYTELVSKYNLIDLYDGKHPAKQVGSKDEPQKLCSLIYKAIREKQHQPFMFHYFGYPDIKDFARFVLRGYFLTYKKDKFIEFIKCLDKARDQVWVAPLVQILKYQEEYKSVQLDVIQNNNDYMNLRLIVGTDPTLYDQKITLIVRGKYQGGVTRVYQNNEQIKDIISTSRNILINVEPKNSTIKVDF